MPYGDMMMAECLEKVLESVAASAVLTRNADPLTIMKTLVGTTVLSPITPRRRLGILTNMTVDTSGTIMKL